MKAYLVGELPDYEGNYIYGVYSTPERAEAAIRVLKQPGPPNVDPQLLGYMEIEVDASPAPIWLDSRDLVR